MKINSMNRQIKHPLLASPSSIGSLELKNRMIMAAMGSNFASEDGCTTETINWNGDESICCDCEEAEYD